MTTKQIEKIKTVNAKSVLDLEMVIFNAFEIAKKLRKISKGTGENAALLFDIEMYLGQILANCEALTPEN